MICFEIGNIFIIWIVGILNYDYNSNTFLKMHLFEKYTTKFALFLNGHTTCYIYGAHSDQFHFL